MRIIVLLLITTGIASSAKHHSPSRIFESVKKHFGIQHHDLNLEDKGNPSQVSPRSLTATSTRRDADEEDSSSSSETSSSSEEYGPKSGRAGKKSVTKIKDVTILRREKSSLAFNRNKYGKEGLGSPRRSIKSLSLKGAKLLGEIHTNISENGTNPRHHLYHLYADFRKQIHSKKRKHNVESNSEETEEIVNVTSAEVSPRSSVPASSSIIITSTESISSETGNREHTSFKPLPGKQQSATRPDGLGQVKWSTTPGPAKHHLDSPGIPMKTSTSLGRNLTAASKPRSPLPKEPAYGKTRQIPRESFNQSKFLNLDDPLLHNSSQTTSENGREVIDDLKNPIFASTTPSSFQNTTKIQIKSVIKIGTEEGKHFPALGKVNSTTSYTQTGATTEGTSGDNLKDASIVSKSDTHQASKNASRTPNNKFTTLITSTTKTKSMTETSGLKSSVRNTNLKIESPAINITKFHHEVTVSKPGNANNKSRENSVTWVSTPSVVIRTYASNKSPEHSPKYNMSALGIQTESRDASSLSRGGDKRDDALNTSLKAESAPPTNFSVIVTSKGHVGNPNLHFEAVNGDTQDCAEDCAIGTSRGNSKVIKNFQPKPFGERKIAQLGGPKEPSGAENSFTNLSLPNHGRQNSSALSSSSKIPKMGSKTNFTPITLKFNKAIKADFPKSSLPTLKFKDLSKFSLNPKNPSVPNLTFEKSISNNAPNASNFISLIRSNDLSAPTLKIVKRTKVKFTKPRNLSSSFMASGSQDANFQNPSSATIISKTLSFPQSKVNNSTALQHKNRHTSNSSFLSSSPLSSQSSIPPYSSNEKGGTPGLMVTKMTKLKITRGYAQSIIMDTNELGSSLKSSNGLNLLRPEELGIPNLNITKSTTFKLPQPNTLNKHKNAFRNSSAFEIPSNHSITLSDLNFKESTTLKYAQPKYLASNVTNSPDILKADVQKSKPATFNPQDLTDPNVKEPGSIGPWPREAKELSFLPNLIVPNLSLPSQQELRTNFKENLETRNRGPAGSFMIPEDTRTSLKGGSIPIATSVIGSSPNMVRYSIQNATKALPLKTIGITNKPRAVVKTKSKSLVKVSISNPNQTSTFQVSQTARAKSNSQSRNEASKNGPPAPKRKSKLVAKISYDELSSDSKESLATKSKIIFGKSKKKLSVAPKFETKPKSQESKFTAQITDSTGIESSGGNFPPFSSASTRKPSPIPSFTERTPGNDNAATQNSAVALSGLRSSLKPTTSAPFESTITKPSDDISRALQNVLEPLEKFVQHLAAIRIPDSDTAKNQLPTQTNQGADETNSHFQNLNPSSNVVKPKISPQQSSIEALSEREFQKQNSNLLLPVNLPLNSNPSQQSSPVQKERKYDEFPVPLADKTIPEGSSLSEESKPSSNALDTIQIAPKNIWSPPKEEQGSRRTFIPPGGRSILISLNSLKSIPSQTKITSIPTTTTPASITPQDFPLRTTIPSILSSVPSPNTTSAAPNLPKSLTGPDPLGLVNLSKILIAPILKELHQLIQMLPNVNPIGSPNPPVNPLQKDSNNQPARNQYQTTTAPSQAEPEPQNVLPKVISIKLPQQTTTLLPFGDEQTLAKAAYTFGRAILAQKPMSAQTMHSNPASSVRGRSIIQALKPSPAAIDYTTKSSSAPSGAFADAPQKFSLIDLIQENMSKGIILQD